MSLRKLAATSRPAPDSYPVDDPTRPSIRWMIRMDLPEVLQIDHESFSPSWTEQDFCYLLAKPRCIGMVIELPRPNVSLVGFMLYELYENRIVLVNFAVSPSHRRIGIGTQLMDHLKHKLSSHRRTRIVLEVRETNLNAQLFFRSQKFRATKLIRRSYDDTGEDAIYMSYRSGDNGPH